MVLPVFRQVAFGGVYTPLILNELRRSVHGVRNHGVNCGGGRCQEKIPGIAVPHLVASVVDHSGAASVPGTFSGWNWSEPSVPPTSAFVTAISDNS